MPIVKRNLNQFKKVYPGIRKTPIYENLITLDQNLTIEAASVAITNSSTVSYTFTQTYTASPVVSASISSLTVGADLDVNLFISSLSATSVTISCSEVVSSGMVHLIIISRSS